MDCSKTGAIIRKLRLEQKLTQKQLSDKMNISDKTISKWERGLGCPDVSLLPELCEIFKVNIESILSAEIGLKDRSINNMKKINFYVCPECNNIITSLSKNEVNCCGRKMMPLSAKAFDDFHQIKSEIIEDEYYIKINHEMKKDHYIAFCALVSFDRYIMVNMYPEQESAIRLPLTFKGDLYLYCTKDGLFKCKL